MGMDIYGKRPSNKTGEYFRANIFGWGPIMQATLDLVPEHITSQCKYWGSNDGDGLGARASKEAARILTEKMNNGEYTAYYAKGRLTGELYDGFTERFEEWIEFLRHCGGFEIC